MEKNKVRLFCTANIAKMGILGAIAGLLMLIEIPLFFAPDFYKVDLSEIPVLLGAFAMGPVAGVIIECIKILLNFVFNGTITAGIGELANLAIGCCFVVPAALIYCRDKNKKTALLGMAVGTLAMTIAGAVLNYYILIPAFAGAFGTSVDSIVAMGTALNKNINSLWDLILLANVPFNLIKGAVSGILTFLLYKRLSPLLHK